MVIWSRLRPGEQAAKISKVGRFRVGQNQDPIKPEVAIILDKERHLRFNFNAAKAFKRETGKSMLDTSVWRVVDEEIIVALVWSLLIHEDKELTIDQVGELLDFGNISTVTDKLSEVYTVSTSEPAEAKKNGPLAQ